MPEYSGPRTLENGMIIARNQAYPWVPIEQGQALISIASFLDQGRMRGVTSTERLLLHPELKGSIEEFGYQIG